MLVTTLDAHSISHVLERDFVWSLLPFYTSSYFVLKWSFIWWKYRICLYICYCVIITVWHFHFLYSMEDSVFICVLLCQIVFRLDDVMGQIELETSFLQHIGNSAVYLRIVCSILAKFPLQSNQQNRHIFCLIYFLDIKLTPLSMMKLQNKMVIPCVFCKDIIVHWLDTIIWKNNYIYVNVT